MEKVSVEGVDVYYYDNGCNVEQWLKNGQLYGRTNAKILESLIIEDGVILDCGAHIGTFALPIALSGRDIICIEAADLNIQCLGKTFEKFDNVKIEKAILADKVKPCGFSRESGPFGWIQQNGELLSTTIDEIMKNYRLPVCGVKLDIEGGEIDALEGAKDTLKQRPPILMEVNGFCLMQSGRTCEDLLKKVASFGYTVYLRFSAQGVILVDPEQMFPWGNTDVVCIHKENVSKYEWTNFAKKLEDFELEYYAKQVKNNSNEDLKSYFEFRGI